MLILVLGSPGLTGPELQAHCAIPVLRTPRCWAPAQHSPDELSEQQGSESPPHKDIYQFRAVPLAAAVVQRRRPASCPVQPHVLQAGAREPPPAPLGRGRGAGLWGTGVGGSTGGPWHGQLGHGTLESEAQPRLVEALAGLPMRAVAAGGWHSASISEAGDLYVWGWNEAGQLALPCKALAEARGEGAGAGAVALTPCPEPPAAEAATFISIQALPALLDLPQEPEVSEVSCGSRHTAAVTRGGELYTWGWGKYGQLGHGDDASSDRPRRVEHLAAEGLRAEAVVCGPWTTYVCVREPRPQRPLSTMAPCGEDPAAARTSPGPTHPAAPQELNSEPEVGLQLHEG